MLALWNRMSQLPEDNRLLAALHDNIALAESADMEWYHTLTSFVSLWVVCHRAVGERLVSCVVFR